MAWQNVSRMALPNKFTGSGNTTPVAEQREGIPQNQESGDDGFAMELLESLCSQLNGHQRVVDQLDSLHHFWDKQQKWNQSAQKNKCLREKILQLQMKHKKQDEERRIQKLIMQHECEVREQICRKEQSMEMQAVQKEMTDHRQEWQIAKDDLEAHQAAVHTHLSGRIVTKNDEEQRQRDKNKSVLKMIMHELTRRRQQKEQVCLL
ncbi:EsV-1-227 [Ectocarpus siliculosus virus 1]|uniref:EsV-1-227 n=1 Tax=Ectocarpus siliculosus virus 1 (isolate New Zealand/Kaikoura/1988) TaxID=654926 RepID=Q8QN63_ESV1K|nr:EsV-1-227 [Ectocarpus siliculosus virus 1]AAK14640.1 EsV-1-227 [Ectocarpus siliculosus virus 1]